ncbi:type II secretion system pilot lipoprotein GspS [Erwinia sp. E_sp_B04_7]|uniref:type II secretion system pilot lipoprotein GspS n=1 Tax=unclassified Erwinia TaxID=2622719 RepID=UPI0030CEBC07
MKIQPGTLPTIILITLATLLSGCQQTSRKDPDPATQIDQISSLVAGSHYLREECGRNDIPADGILLSNAFSQAGKKGWNTRAPEYKELMVAIGQKKALIVNDRTQPREKCQKLQAALARFVAGSQQRS